MIAISQESFDNQLNKDLQRLWDLEGVGLPQVEGKEHEAISAEKFRHEIRYDPGKRHYSVRWSSKEDRLKLPTNYRLALGRIKALLRIFDHGMRLHYDETIRYPFEKEVVELAPDHYVHYIPHYCIIKPDHVTTKLRVVYDLSAKCTKSKP